MICGYCGHPGDHAEVIPFDSRPTRCPTQCEVCKKEIARERGKR